MTERLFWPVMSVALAFLVTLSGLITFVNVPMDAEPTNGESMETVSLYFDRDRFDFDIDVDVVDAHNDADLIRMVNGSVSSERFVVSDAVIDSLVDALNERMDGMTDKEKASALLDFVYMNTWYGTDNATFGQSEYVQYPSETLYRGHGDCEDLAFLLYVLYEGAGLNAVLVHCVGHVATAVDVGGYGEIVTFKGKEYTIADPTSSMDLGKRPLDVLYVDTADNSLMQNMLRLLIVCVELLIGYFMLMCWRHVRE